MMLKSGFCGYRDAYILLSCRIKIARALASDATKKAYKNDKKITFKNWAPFIKNIGKINNTQVDDTQEIDVVMPMYNLIK